MTGSSNSQTGIAPSLAGSLSQSYITACGLICFLLMAAVMFWLSQNIVYPAADTTSYVDIARNVRAGRFLELTNPYWSPLYPALLGILLPARISVDALRTSLVALQVAVHSLYIVALLYFVTGLSRYSRLPGDRFAKLSFALSLLFGMALYLKFAVCFTPDALVSVTVLLALGMISRLLVAPSRWRPYAALGFVLGMAYWAKAVMLPASLVLLALLAATQWMSAQRMKPALIAGAVFVAAAAPAVVLASVGAHTFTFGESGKLNYAWNVNRYQLHRGWIGREPGSGTPLHPPRVLVEHPLVLEFADPGHGAFPLWYDPALWHRGVRIRLSPFEIAAALRTNLSKSYVILLCLAMSMPAILFGWPAHLTLPQWKSYYGCFFAWPLLVLAAYLPVAIELRYAVPFIVAFLVASLWACPAETRSGSRILAAQLALVCLVSVWMLGGAFGSRKAVESRWDQERAASRYLGDRGVRKGDRLVALNRTDGSMLYLLPLDVQVVSWLRQAGPGDLTPDEWNRILEKWRSLHIKAAISLPKIGGDSSEADMPAWMGFQKVPGAQYFVKILEP